jgi:Sugar (and other) transporter
VVLAVLVSENWILTFLTVKLFPAALELIGLHGCMLIFAATCFGGAIFVIFVLPETKGKSIEDIVDDLEGKK